MLLFGVWLVFKDCLVLFIVIEIVVVVVVGDNILRGEELGVIVLVVIKGSGRGVGIFVVGGLVEGFWVVVGEIFVGVGMGVSKLFEI